MGQGYSSELGEACLGERVRDELNEVLQWLRSNDPSLTEVSTPDLGIGDDGIEQGARALVANEYLEAIDLAYNGISSYGCTALASQLKVSACANNTLKVLRLSGNPIGEAGCEKLCEWLAGNPPLQELYLYNCGLTDECVLHLANALQRNTTLQKLDINGNEKITNRSVIMLSQAMANNLALSSLGISQPEKVRFSKEHFDSLMEAVHKNAVALDAKRQLEQQRERQRQEKERVAAERRAERDRQIALEKEKVQQEISALETLKLQEEAEIRRLEGVMEQKLRARNAASEAKSAAREAELARRAEESQKWRLKLTNNGTLVKEWRSGFTVLKMEPGEVTGTPKSTADGPRRLKPCWCDPQDAAAPYAKTLHYHCKHEKIDSKVDDAATGAPHYDGCKRTGHRCATVGFYAKPLPDLSPAFFFASPHPSSVANGGEE